MPVKAKVVCCGSLYLLLYSFLLGSFLAAPRSACGQTPEELRATNPPPNALWLDTLDVSQIIQGWGTPHAGRSVEDHPLTLKGVVYPHGIGTHALSTFQIALKRVATRFVSMVGVDDEKTGNGSVTFEVWVDGKKRADSGVLHGGDTPKLLSVDLTGAKWLNLVVTDAGDGFDSDHADWAGALLFLTPGAKAKPQAMAVPVEPPRMVVPPPDPRPALHGPRIVGATPGRPFLFLIPATGDGPLTFSARNLPAGLTLDANTGIIRGSLQQSGTTVAEITVHGPLGTARRELTIVGGEHKLALTPPLGWNSWNVWAGAVDAGKVRQAADAMVASGLAAHGFAYVNIDDTWEGSRDAGGDITTNDKFGDMKALADYMHGKGLKLGIYSSPGPKTCGGFEGSYQHEGQDARTYAQWGIDYLKYDWCSYGDIAHGGSLEELQKPYAVMRAALDKVDRDIVFSFCQYGMGNVWEWGAQIGGNCWRTTGDINDSWGSLHDIYSHQDGHEKYAGPGHWNDPDMLVVGQVGWGSPHPSHLTPNEQILHITMWCLLSAPLLIGCDMTHLDPFTIALLSNDEALDINQDPLGKPAGRKSLDGSKEVWARPLWDGTMAVGLLNSGPEATEVTARWSDLGLHGRQPVRDLWLHKNVGTFADVYTVSVPAHGAVLLKIGKPQRR
ncbi:MAG TPA: NPCBM/NEW2 domain-containing protein [Chthonomonadaceae bacterium]|nr:NPCBM/NEW2 domain-containing protein [Chthonomonadaceae bacterium]